MLTLERLNTLISYYDLDRKELGLGRSIIKGPISYSDPQEELEDLAKKKKARG